MKVQDDIMKDLRGVQPDQSGQAMKRDHNKCKHSFLAHLDRTFGPVCEAERLNVYADRLKKEYVGAAETSLAKMLPSHITRHPTGHEHGIFLALDIGGSNVRVAIVKLHERTTIIQAIKCWEIPLDMKHATEAAVFFEWLAKCVQCVVMQMEAPDGGWKLGVSWSFPFEQTSITHAKLHKMGKGFRLQSIVGCDINQLLQDGFQACNLKDIKVCAILNDAVATLLSCAYMDRSTRLGMILGTGTNATCMVPLKYFGKSKLPLIKDFYHDGMQATGVLVNSEWSMFGGDTLPLTAYDVELNAKEELPGYQPFEYLIGGRTIGELVRLILLDAHYGYSAFEDWIKVPSSWHTPWSFEAKTMSVLEADTSATRLISRQILEELHPLPSPQTYTIENIDLIRSVCVFVSNRAVSLLAAAIIGIVDVAVEVNIPKTPLPVIDFENAGDYLSARVPSATPANVTTPKLIGTNGFSKSERLYPAPISVHNAAFDYTKFASNSITVSYTGTVLEKYHQFKERLQAKLDQLCDIRSQYHGRILIKHIDEGGVVGAAVLAAMYVT